MSHPLLFFQRHMASCLCVVTRTDRGLAILATLGKKAWDPTAYRCPPGAGKCKKTMKTGYNYQSHVPDKKAPRRKKPGLNRPWIQDRTILSHHSSSMGTLSPICSKNNRTVLNDHCTSEADVVRPIVPLSPPWLATGLLVISFFPFRLEKMSNNK